MSAADKLDKVKSDSNTTNSKPMVVIDCLSSPYQVIEPSPNEIINIYSDEDDAIVGGLINQQLESSKQTPSKKLKKQKQQASSQQQNMNQASTGSAAVRV